MSSLALTDLTAVLVLGVACWAMRATFVVLVPADRLPDLASRALQHLAPAALASICAVEVTGVIDTSDLTATAASVGVVALAVLVASRTRSMTWTVLAGILAVLAVDLVVVAS